MQDSLCGVNGNTLARQIHTALKKRILNGELAPGTRLKDNEVAALFGTSNTPVREALRDLAKDGLVEVHPYRGCMVRCVDGAEMAEVLDVCEVLEPLAARLAASRLTDGELDRLERLALEHEEASQSGHRAQRLTAGLAFHQLVVDAAGNGTLSRIFDDLLKYGQIYHRAQASASAAPNRPTHGEVAAALRARDGEQAAALMAAHLACSRRQITLAQQPLEATLSGAD